MLYRITAIALFLAVFNLPYGYYIFLRLLVSITAGLTFLHYKSEVGMSGKTIAFLIVLLLYNPIIPVYLSKEAWVPINLIAMVLFIIEANTPHKSPDK